MTQLNGRPRWDVTPAILARLRRVASMKAHGADLSKIAQATSVTTETVGADLRKLEELAEEKAGSPAPPAFVKGLREFHNQVIEAHKRAIDACAKPGQWSTRAELALIAESHAQTAARMIVEMGPAADAEAALIRLSVDAPSTNAERRRGRASPVSGYIDDLKPQRGGETDASKAMRESGGVGEYIADLMEKR